MFFSGLVLRIKIKKRWTSLTDYVDFCSVLHGLQIAEYSITMMIVVNNERFSKLEKGNQLDKPLIKVQYK